MNFTEDQMVRYSRQMLVSEIGEEGQKKIGRGRVLVIGAGGLGSPVSFYLVAAGVGTLGIIDNDVVELSNLQRQILHSTKDIGRPKVDSARAKLEALNPEVQMVSHHLRLQAGNAKEIIQNYDIVVDATDNFATRFIINDACVMLGKPFVHGGVLGLSGQALTIIPGQGPCFRCIFPEQPPERSGAASGGVGVLGVAAGTIGLIQATEVLKYLLGQGDLLVGRLLMYDALPMKFREIQVMRNPQCQVCGEHRKTTGA